MMPDTPSSTNYLTISLYKSISVDEDFEGELFLGNQKIDEDYLIINADQPRDSVYMINLTTTARFPICVSYHELSYYIENGDLLVSDVEYDKQVTMAPERLSDNKKRKIEARWKIIEPLVLDIDSVLKNENGQRLFADIAQKNNCTRQHVYNVWYSWLRYGCRKQCLCMPIGKDANKKKNNKRYYSVKPGRPNEDIPRGKILNEYDFQRFEIGKRLYGKRNGLSITGVVRKLWEKYYFASRTRKSDLEFELTKTRYQITLLPPNERPTMYQFYYWLKNQYNGILPKRDRSRKNPTEYAANLQGRKGNAFSHAIGPGEIFQLDETPFDEEIVSVFDPDRKTPLGKATLYFVRDAFSRAIVGLYITTQNPSYATAKEALFNAARSKKQFLLEHHSLVPPEAWPMEGLPKALLVDQAEFNNQISEGFIEGTATKIMFTPGGRGDSKGLIEKIFDIFSNWFKGLSEAHQTKSHRDIALQIARKRACLNIPELYQIAIIFAVHFNNKQKLTNYPLTLSMVQDKVEEVPTQLWNWGLKYRAGYLDFKKDSELYIALLEKAEVSVHRRHIYLKDRQLRYTCDWLRENGYQDRKPSGNKALCLDARLHRGLVDIIFICTDDGMKPAYLDSVDQRFLGSSFDEVKPYKQARKAPDANIFEDSLNSLVNGQAVLENMLRNARKEKAPSALPKIGKIRDSRCLESIFDRIQQSNRFLTAVHDEFIEVGSATHHSQINPSQSSNVDIFKDDDDNDALDSFYGDS